MIAATPQALLLVGLTLVTCLVYHVVYRLYLSPLAKIPGPRAAALTGAYEMYYDLIEKARFPWKIEELHKEYGIDHDERLAESIVDSEQKVPLSAFPRTKFISTTLRTAMYIFPPPMLFNRISMLRISINSGWETRHSIPLMPNSIKSVAEQYPLFSPDEAS